MKPKIGFIGQGWLGKNSADHFEERGFPIIRYSHEPEYAHNKEKIKECDIVFIAVPTPQTPEGFNDSIVREVVNLVGEGKIAVIKSTIVPGTTRSIQGEQKNKIVVHVPEFLREASAREDIEHPDRNIIGIVDDNEKTRSAAELILSVIAKAPYNRICSAEEAELTKYGTNVYLYFKLLYANMFYDVATQHKVDWNTFVDNLTADPRIGKSHLQPIHQYKHLGEKIGRGAGGHCLIKDFAAFHEHYKKVVGDEKGVRMLDALRDKNIKLLVDSEKDIELLSGVYGKDLLK